MKYTIFYFNNKISRMFEEKIDEQGNKSMVLTSPYNFVSSGEIVAKIVNVDEIEELDSQLDEGYNYHTYEKYIHLKAGDGISFDEDNSVYSALDYGFVKYDRDKSAILLIYPFRIQKDKMKAYYIIHPTKFKKIPSLQEIEEHLTKLNIYTMIDKNKLAHALNEIDVNKAQVHRITVAQGREPKDGFEEHFIPLIDFEKKAGKILEDGSIDFKEIGSIVEVKKRQGILKRIPAEKPEDGYNIYGIKASGKMKETVGYLVGDNIVPSIDPNIYTSSIDGCLEMVKRTVSVSPISLIKGDVNYDSGNIDFSGTVQISGSVLPGFKVKAEGDIIIGKNVDDAVIEAGGNINVKLGIGGKGSTNVTAGGKINAKFILNSKVEAMGMIQVDDSIINSNVFSNEKIIVTDKHGKIIGGETTALYEIHAKISGVPKENKTILIVGQNIFVEKDLMEIRNTINSIKRKIEEITQELKSSYGKEIFSNPKGLLSILPPIKKKPCLELLSELTMQNKELQKSTDQYKAKESELKFEHDPIIEITDKVYPGTLIKIKKSIRMIEETLRNAKFYEDPEQKIIRFTSAK